MNNLLITGGAGFIGSHFVKQRVLAGDKVTVIDSLTYAGSLENLKEVEEKIEFYNADICDASKVRDLLKSHTPQAVINFAAESHVDRSIDGPAQFIQTNIMGVFQLLNESYSYWKGLPSEEQAQFRFLQVSTDEVFGELGDTGYFSETSNYKPSSPYSASKAAGDHLTHAWFHTYGLPTLITNCSNNYGPNQFPEKLIPRIIDCALSEQPLPVYGKGENVRDWIHVEDHAQGVHLALTRGTPGETYCFGGNSERKNIDVVNTICEILNEVQPRKDQCDYKEQIEFVTDRAGHDWRYAIDSTKAQSELGFERTYSFESGLRHTVEWYLNHQDWINAVKEESKIKELS